MKLKSAYNLFTVKEQKAADYILSHVDETVSLSVQELAKRADTSPSTIIRLSSKAGYESFPALKIDLAKLDRDPVEKDIIIDRKDTSSDIAHTLSSIMTEVANESQALFNKEDFERVVEKITGADKIYILGIGSSGIIAEDLWHKLIRIGKNAIYCTDSHVQMLMGALSAPGDVVIAFSCSGKTDEVNESLKHHKNMGAFTVAVTRAAKSPITTICDISLYHSGYEGEYRVGAIASEYAQLFVSNMIFLAVTQKDYDKNKTHIKNSRKIIRDFKGGK